MAHTETVSLGDLINLFYEEFMTLYGDEDLASLAAAASINDLLSAGASRVESSNAAA
jgi:hypothetical protein